jgi:hypothetical protein
MRIYVNSSSMEKISIALQIKNAYQYYLITPILISSDNIEKTKLPMIN